MIQNNVLKVGDVSEKTVNVSETFKVFNVRIAFLCSSLCLDPSWSAKLHKKKGFLWKIVACTKNVIKMQLFLLKSVHLCK